MTWGRHAARSVAVAAALALLGSCVRGLHITVEGDLGHPVFVLAPAGLLEFSKPCVTQATLSAAGAPYPLVWELRSKDPDCTDTYRLPYAGPTAGLEVLQGPTPLHAGVEYRLHVEGSGWVGDCQFAWRNGRFELDRETCLWS